MYFLWLVSIFQAKSKQKRLSKDFTVRTYVCVYGCMSVRVRCESHFNRFSCLFVFMLPLLLSLLAVASSASSVSTCAQARRLKVATAAQANKLFII